MKIGMDFGNKTFSFMRVVDESIEPIPNISPYLYGQSQESCPAIFKEQDGQWKLARATDSDAVTNVVRAADGNKLKPILASLLQTITTNDPGNAIDEIVIALPKNEAQANVLKESVLAASEQTNVEGLDESIAALFGSTIYDDLLQKVGTTETILVLDGKVHTLRAVIYKVTVTMEEQAIHMHVTQLSESQFDTLSGDTFERMLAARAKEIAEEAGMLPMDEIEPHEWLRFVDYVKGQFLTEDVPYIGGDFTFNNGYDWEEPAELDSEDMYNVFSGHAFTLDGHTTTRYIEADLQKAIHALCDESSITVDDIETIILAGGALRLPFWRRTIQQLFQHATTATLPENITEVALVGRGCAQYIRWKEAYQFSYTLSKRTGAYVGIALIENDEPVFKPLLLKRNDTSSGALLLQVPTDEPLIVTVYEGPQTDDVALCTKQQTIRLFHTTLQQLCTLNYVAFRLVTEEEQLFYEIRHPYTDEQLLKGALAHDNRAKESKLND